MSNDYLTVTELSKILKGVIEESPLLNNVLLKGEISNFKKHTSGHLYFSIKDENSVIRAIMFRGQASALKFTPKDGMKVLITGRISIYEAAGNYQIYVESLNEDGLGNLFIAFEELKEKLSKEGLFDESHKKKIPKMPNRVGVITAATGAAIRDIFSTINRRYPICEVILLPSLVQGENAKESLVRQLKKAEELNLDTLIIGRGGGSIEDLWPFNEEIVARAIYNSTIPIISGVGHENDYTISDFVSDLRAPTPTGAAEMAVPNMYDIITYINNTENNLTNLLSKTIEIKKEKYVKLKENYILKNPLKLYENKSIMLDNYKDKLTNIIKNIQIKYNNSFNILNKTLKALDPISTKFRGYAIISIDNNIKGSVKDIREDDQINISMKDGDITSKVISIKEAK